MIYLDINTKKHIDGSVCLEGTRKLPLNYAPCCDDFHGHTATCVNDVRYEWIENLKIWWIAISDQSGGGGIEINYCPHCGAKLNK